MSYFDEIQKHIKNSFANYNVETLDALPTKGDLSQLDPTKLYKVDFAAIAVDVVNYKKMSEYTDEDVMNIIMNEFSYGSIKVMNQFLKPLRIESHGDSIYAIYRITSEENIDSIFETACALNSFQQHLNKMLDKWEVKLSDGSYNHDLEFKFGIGASYSTENYISIVGNGRSKELIVMGHAINCARELAKSANRNEWKEIIVDASIEDNFTPKKKKQLEEIGGFKEIWGVGSNDEDYYESDWIKSNYSNYVDSNV